MQQKLGKYILEELIAVGGMAEIFRAHTSSLGGVEKILAIKRLHEHYCTDQDFVQMLVNEARIAVQLNHKNIAQVFDLEQENDAYFIAMEYIHGRDLHRVARRFLSSGRMMPLGAAVFITQEICAGLSYAHRRTDARGMPLNIIHRDISPQNILVSFEGEVKIVDFGIAKAASRASMTHSGVIKGKFYYMSPEQARGDMVDQRTDIFSVGAILFEMITGRMLYEGDDDANLVQRVRRAEFPRPSAISPDIPPQLEQIILKALARDKHARFGTARDMQLALTQFMQSHNMHVDSVIVSQLMHEVFQTGANADSAVYEAVGHARMGHPDYQSNDNSLVAQAAPHRGVGLPSGPNPRTDVRWVGENGDEAETSVYGRDHIGDIVEELDAAYDEQRGESRELQRAELPVAHAPIDIGINESQYRSETLITGNRPRRPYGPRGGSPPTMLYLLAVGGVLLLAWAFLFATQQLTTAAPQRPQGPRLQASGDDEMGFQVRSSPSGAEVLVDGSSTGLRTPVVLHNVTPGQHEITLKLRHHETALAQVSVEKDGVFEVSLEPRKGILKIDSVPTGAELHVDGKSVGSAPVHLDGMSMRDAHRVAASLDGYKNMMKSVHWEHDEAIFRVELRLTPAELQYGDVLDAFMVGAGAHVIGALMTVPGGAPAVAENTASVETPEQVSTPDKPKQVARRRVARRRASSSSSSGGMVSVNAKPPGELFIDGKNTGKSTPVRQMEVSTGYHRVKVYFPQTKQFSGEKRALVKPGAEVKLMFRQ